MIKKILIGLGCLVLFCFIVLALFYVAAGGDYRLPPTTAENPSLPSVAIEGVTFHAETFGDPKSPVVIVLHGGPGNDYRYLLALTTLSDSYRVVFYDQRGTGLSPRVPVEQLTLENMIEDVDRIVNHYGGGKAVRLVGHSWGAMLVSAYLGRHPGKVSHALLAEPGLLTADAARAFLEKFKFHPGWTEIKALSWLWLQSRHVKAEDPWAKDDWFFTQLSGLSSRNAPTAGYFCGGLPPKGGIPAWRFSFSSSMAIQGKGLSDAKNIALDLVKGVEKYKGKTLFLCGSCDVIIGEEHQRKFHLPFFPGASFVVIPNCGHAMFNEKPVESLAVTKAFLADKPLPKF